MKWAILGHFHIFAHFYLKNGLKVRNYGNLNRKSQFFHYNLYLRPRKKNSCVQVSFLKKNRVGR